MRSKSRRHTRDHAKVPQPQPSRISLYDEVTAKIVRELEAGRFPWAQPWGSAGAAAHGLPRNAHTGRCYSGVNVLLLWGAAIEQGHPSQGWLTFRQALEAGGAVRKGERGVIVFYADRFIPKSEAEGATRHPRGWGGAGGTVSQALHRLQCRAVRWLAPGTGSGSGPASRA